MSVPVLELADVSKAYGGVRAVDDVSFRLAAGEMLALIGPNGAGKTTCFNTVMGQVRPDAGAIRVAGRVVTGWAPRRIWRLGVGRTFQIATTFGSMTVRENVQMALISRHGETRNLSRPARRRFAEEADALLERVGMADQGDRPASILAYGDLKRLDIAIALANRPRLLLLDEPTAGMAPGERGALMALVSDIVRAETLACLFTEHDMDVVFGHADRVLVMHQGRIIADGPPARVRADDEVRRVYLGTSA